MLMRFDPFRELDRLTQSFGGVNRPAPMPMDAYRRDDMFIVEFDLPGIDPSMTDLTVEKNVLTVRAERQPTRREEDEVLVSERPYGVLSRQLFLGEGLDVDNVKATYDRGVLTLTIPVAPQAKPRRVEISAGDSQPQSVEASARSTVSQSESQTQPQSDSATSSA
jgi:HSP20 family protein